MKDLNQENEIELEGVQQYVSWMECAERGLELGGQDLSARLNGCHARALHYSPPSINVTPISVNPLQMLTFFYSPHIAHYKC